MRKPWVALGMGFVALALAGCSYYSFSGGSVPEDVATLAIPPVEVRAAIPDPTLGDQLTTLLTDRLIRQTRLRLAEDEATADAVLTASLSSFTDAPTAITGDERASRNRVTLTVQARFARREAEQPYFERSFQAFADYDPIADGADGINRAAAAALVLIADDIFTAATSQW